MFLRGSSRTKVLNIIRETVRWPDKIYTQKDGRKVLLKKYKEEVGELPHFDENGRLTTRLLKTMRVVYNIDRKRNVQVITAHPLFLKY